MHFVMLRRDWMVRLVAVACSVMGLFYRQLQKVPTSVVASLPTWSLCRPHSVLWPIGLFYHYCPQGTSRFTVFLQSFGDGRRTVPFLICTFLMVSPRLLIQRPLYLRHTMRLHAATGSPSTRYRTACSLEQDRRKCLPSRGSGCVRPWVIEAPKMVTDVRNILPYTALRCKGGVEEAKG